MRVSSRAEFLDGPLQGQVREFDRSEPPLSVYTSTSGGRSTEYVRDMNPFDDGEMWVYMLKVSVDDPATGSVES
ncbi:hypothetical protein SEA_REDWATTLEHOG_208 [Gordonia phage RedWattleHog]|uniref:Uncharacterized protein n=1 Tax=Gordonia phage Stormageddon TaxID=2656541 RepID=A0A649VSZ1_9CAUD|nr:hypothetical protein KHQ86_gp091 [Gordonia phage Stormageddon]QGJ95069.1 hypothetical protein SEA_STORMAGEDDON_209 [Gordonia phage Stormageddon]QLF83711.1 hypothetical protein SEA_REDWATTLEHOG_208 [Gordonia phage RedWattleHog]